MSKYNINIDPELPNKEETKSFQNFDSLITDAQKMHRPGYVLQNIHKNFKLVKIVILIMVVLITLYFSHKYSTEEFNEPTKTNQNSNLIVNSPYLEL